MPDDAAATVDAGGVTYEVVAYSDVRAVAADAAGDALARQSERTSADLEALAAAAADDALTRRELSDAQAREQWQQEQADALSQVAQDAAASAADAALDGVQSKLDAQLAEMDERAEATQTVVAVLDSDQWDVLVGTHQAFVALLVFEVVLLGAILGALLWLSVLSRRS